MQLLDDHQLEPLAQELTNTKTSLLGRTILWGLLTLGAFTGFLNLYFAWDLFIIMIILLFVFLLTSFNAITAILDLFSNKTKQEDLKITQKQNLGEDKILFVLDVNNSKHIQLKVNEELYKAAQVNCYVRILKGYYSNIELIKMIMPPKK